MKTTITTIAIFFFALTANKATAQNNTSSIETATSVRGPKVTAPTTTATAVKVYPMQIAEGIMTVQLINQPTGAYTIEMVNAAGKVVASKEVNHQEGTSVEVISAGKTLEGGMYQVNVIKPNNTTTSNKVMLLM